MSTCLRYLTLYLRSALHSLKNVFLLANKSPVLFIFDCTRERYESYVKSIAFNDKFYRLKKFDSAQRENVTIFFTRGFLSWISFHYSSCYFVVVIFKFFKDPIKIFQFFGASLLSTTRSKHVSTVSLISASIIQNDYKRHWYCCHRHGMLLRCH